MRVLVTGGAGYIGSVVTEELLLAGHHVSVLDDLSNGHPDAVPNEAVLVRGSVLDRQLVRRVLQDREINAVVHLAAVSIAGESVLDPARYYLVNVEGGLSLLEAMRDAGVRRIVFSSSAAVYGESARQPLREADPAAPVNAYGETKLAFERALEAYGRAYGIQHVSLRYFNAAGASERNGERHDPETHLIPLALDVASGSRAELVLFGDDHPTSDGTCVRDYVHVVDLARAHVLSLKLLSYSAPAGRTFNVGCGEGYSVRQVLDAVRDVTGRDIRVRVAPRRAGDPAALIACPERIRQELGFSPERRDLRGMVESAWRWLKDGPGRRRSERVRPRGVCRETLT